MIKNLVLIVAAALLSSCNPTAYISQSFNPSNMKGIGYFEPQAYISVVQKGNRALPNDSLSGVAQYLLDSIIGHSRTFKTVRRMESPDFVVQQKIHVELNNTFSQVMRNKTIEGVALPLPCGQKCKRTTNALPLQQPRRVLAVARVTTEGRLPRE
ncbi:hypothetical protein [Arundinibacter roseus]|uniref:DUF4136 domain-containing protein n=1 Tax=Arundinibacter roseus TaxID=2070510 RepID=A0A4R4K447_9BACT|nr:hypothetical protein [Arundinibacter roseus]TDB60869.1 hypothetical protein EZE20_20720 [Arundinibacter roseus]